MVPQFALQAGDVFAGDYEVLRPLAKGGMGAVYAVRQRSTGQLRALKVMLPAALADDGLRARFEREARISSRIASDHVVEVFAAGVDAATQVPWLAMEMLDGADLAATLRARKLLPPNEIALIMGQLGHALSRAHAAGIVHRDLKPENIFLAKPRVPAMPFMVKVLDFGIAKVLQESMTSGTSTEAIGSPLWMSPEQTESGGRVGPPADVFALGLVVFKLLTGFGFWRAANTPGATYGAVIREMFVEAIPTASARAAEYGVGHLIPRGFDAWFARCVVKEPSARFADASQAIPALLEVLSGAAAPTPPAHLALSPTLPSLAAAPVAEPAPRTMALPQHVIETAVSQALGTAQGNAPAPGHTGVVLGAAPPTAQRAAPAPVPPKRSALKYVVGAAAFVAVAATAGVIASRATQSTQPSEVAKPPPGALVGPIPVVAPPTSIDAGLPTAAPPLDAGTVAPQIDPRTGRPRAATDAGWPFVPTVFDVGVINMPSVDVPAPQPIVHDAGPSAPPVVDAGSPVVPAPQPHDAGPPVVPAPQPHDAGSPVVPTPQPHDAGPPVVPAPQPHDAGPPVVPAPQPRDAGAPATPHTPDPQPAARPDPCGEHHTCRDCSLRIGCGWCGGANRCISDDRRGNAENRACGAWASTPSECARDIDPCAHIRDCRACVGAAFCAWCPGRGCALSTSLRTCAERVVFESDCR